MRNAFCTDVHCPKFRSFFHSFLCCMLIKNSEPPMFEFQLSDQPCSQNHSQQQLPLARLYIRECLAHTQSQSNCNLLHIYSHIYNAKVQTISTTAYIPFVEGGIGIFHAFSCVGTYDLFGFCTTGEVYSSHICIELPNPESSRAVAIQQYTIPLHSPRTKCNLRDFIFTRN